MTMNNFKTFKFEVLTDNCILIELSQKFIPCGLVFNRPALLQHLPGGRLNKKDGLTRYGDSHVKDKTS